MNPTPKAVITTTPGAVPKRLRAVSLPPQPWRRTELDGLVVGDVVRYEHTGRNRLEPIIATIEHFEWDAGAMCWCARIRWGRRSRTVQMRRVEVLR